VAGASEIGRFPPWERCGNPSHGACNREGHAQEFKTQALALQVGKRLRVMISNNNAGIDDCLIGGKIGGVIAEY
jgi:hypothetical protein